MLFHRALSNLDLKILAWMSVNKNPVNKAKAEIYLEIENITVGKEN